MSEIVGILESVGPTIVVEITDFGPQGEQGEQGPQGEIGPQGPIGLKGDKPAHSWSGTSLTFENPDGTPGTPVDLEGPIGPAPTINYPALAGEIDYDELSDSLDPESIADILMEDDGFKASVKGDQGPQGEIGPQGPQGEIGPEGPQGPIGETGADGPQGLPGSDAPATPVVNALNSTSTTSALSANQGKVLNEGKADNTEVIIVVKHGTDGNTARPVGASVVYWVGTAEPTKALNDDMWLGEE
ncbi:MAG TPA: hypothetical protein VFD14_04210 [Clostridia bacterium]|nr:hypothetical protein [Clostridia bacterium]